MVQHPAPVVRVELLRLQDMLELVHALQSVVHVRRQMAVEEAHLVAVEREAHRHRPFVSLEKK